MPLIDRYLAQGKTITLASDGDALTFWKKEYPQLNTLTLPAYDIHYPSGGNMALRIFAQIPKLNKRFKEELTVMDEYLSAHPAELLISDSRFGLHTDQCRTVFMTHQVFIQSPMFPQLVNKKNHAHMSKFDEVWVPDSEGKDNLSGELGHGPAPFKLTYIGALSRFRKMRVMQDIDILVVLSGPEPQRSILEKALIPRMNKSKTCVLVRGKVNESNTEQRGNIELRGHATSEELNVLIERSALIICRSGYSSIMDLTLLHKKAILIPTPGQTEQEYLARHVSDNPLFSMLEQKDIATHLEEMLA
jgi:UDP:flavonoid glycosyltransferase YjiC (YdhE family)